ncbi:MAG: hypothetical protein GXO16_04925, partial [Epsilonproteobacteria bacterium]|nr:hypothetical protein [Campylobacterota bacterium]
MKRVIATVLIVASFWGCAVKEEVACPDKEEVYIYTTRVDDIFFKEK